MRPAQRRALTSPRTSCYNRPVTDRDFYEALVPLAAAQLGALRDADEAELRRIEIDDVACADDGSHVVVIFRDPERAGCRFGWRWSWAEGPRPDEAEFAAALLATNFEEDLLSDRYGLPPDCAPDTVTWL